MKQLPLPGMNKSEKIVNVATVKHRSPFRYPGGKTWLVPHIRTWLQSMSKATDFVEPFSGGAIVGLTVAFEELANHVTLVEVDNQVSAVWETIINRGEGVWLANQILSFKLTTRNLDNLLSKSSVSLKEQAFQTILKNRVNRGGIIASGAGRVKNGENGRGILSRWYPETLARRIKDIDSIRDRLTFVAGDGLKIIEQSMHREDVVFFVDPPYTASSKKPGSRLYDHSDLDHHKLFALLAEIKGQFLMTYDNAQEIRDLAEQSGFEYKAVSMKSTHHAKLSELLIGKNLDWV